LEGGGVFRITSSCRGKTVKVLYQKGISANESRKGGATSQKERKNIPARKEGKAKEGPQGLPQGPKSS